MNNKNPYLPVSATIEKVVRETPNIKTFFLKPEKPFEFKAGQYLEARCGAATALIAIQPAGVDLDAPLSETVATAVSSLADALIELLTD